MFSRFYRPSASWIAFLRKAWREKIPERSEDDFFLSSQARKGRLAAKGNPRPLPLKSGKTASFFTGKKNADLPACILLVGMSGMSDLLGSIGVEYIIGHFHGESPDSVQEFLSGRHSVFKSGKLLFPLPG